MTHFQGMPKTIWQPPMPQLIKNARMLIVGYKAERSALEEILPPGLTPHPNNVVQMNMYEIDAAGTSGFGAFSLTYLTIEVEGYDSYAAEGTMPIPGRYFAYYWNSSPRVISYARESSGIPAMLGTRSATADNEGLTSTLSIDGETVISVSARTSEIHLGSLGGHLNYYSHRQFPSASGGTTVVDELLELPLPFVAELYEADVSSIDFSFPAEHPAARLAPTSKDAVHGVMYGDVTFTYSMGRVLRDYQAERSVSSVMNSVQ